MINLTRCMAGLVFLMIIGVTGARAQATRTWVSGVGDDANPCSRTAPCKTFAGAISKTAASGEIDVLDPGGFGAVTITKAITIDGGSGQIAGVLVAGTNGIVVSAGANDVVILRNLDINGIGGAGLSGIRFIAGKMLYVENSNIYGFVNYGIDFEPTGTSALSVDRTLVRTNGLGLYVKPGPSGAASVTVVGSRFEGSTAGAGVRAEDNSEVTISGSTASGNARNGFTALSKFFPVEINLEGCVSASNAMTGIAAAGPGAIVRMSNTMVTHNATGIAVAGGGSVVSFLNNRIAGNSTNGSPTSSIAQQ